MKVEFKIGQKIKIESIEETGKKRLKTDKIGEIVEVTKRIIVLQFKNYRESLSVADFQRYKIFVRANKNWIQLKIK
jgi:outer membrane protein assembly factor BamA